MGQFLDIAEAVLAKQNRPMRPREIIDFAKDHSLLSDKLSGKTPSQTLKAKISVDIRRKGTGSRFVRTAPNTFYLRELLQDSAQVYTALRQSPSGSGERVIAFPSSVLDRFGRFQGITRLWQPFLEDVLSDNICAPLARLEAEHREDQKQLLTYLLVTRRNQLLCFRRGTFNRIEDYLRGSLCVGFGGHVAETDQTLYNAGNYRRLILDNAVRELSEELKLPVIDRERLSNAIGLKIIGVLNDDSSSTGRKHLAVVMRYETSDAAEWDKPQRGEKSITQLNWLDLKSFSRELREFEYWSQLCLSEFFKGTVATQASFVLRRKAPLRRHKILCIIGGIGSGKSAATEILTKEFGYTEINSGKIMADLLNIPPVPQSSRYSFQSKAWQFIQQRTGPTRLAAALLGKAHVLSPPILIDGIRQRKTLEELRRKASPLSLAVLFVHTPPHIAYQFYRERSGHKIGIHEFLKLCDAPVEGEVRKLIADADAVLYNWTGKLKYEQAIRQMMREIKR